MHIIKAVILLTCLLLTGCHSSNMLNSPFSTPVPNTTCSSPLTEMPTLSTDPTVPTTQEPTVPATTVPKIKTTVTPVNTKEYNLFDGTRVPLNTSDYGNLDQPNMGEVSIASAVLDAIDGYSDQYFLFVGVDPSWTVKREMESHTLDIEAYRNRCIEVKQELMQRFTDAGYRVTEWTYSDTIFEIQISIEQLMELDCGTDMAVAIIPVEINYIGN